MPQFYSQLFANQCLNGVQEATTACKGKVVWTAKFPQKSVADSHVVLTGKGIVAVDASDVLLAYTKDGHLHWAQEKNPQLRACVSQDLFWTISPGTYSKLQSIGFDGKIKHSELHIPGMEPSASIEAFCPIENGFIAHLFTRMQNGAARQEIYKMHWGKLGWFDWIHMTDLELGEFPGIVSLSHQRMWVSMPPRQVLSFDLNQTTGAGKKAKPTEEFTLPFGGTDVKMACGEDGTLYLCGTDEERAALVACDLSGKVVWKWVSGVLPFQNDREAICPPLVSGKHVLFVSRSRAFAVERGSEVWSYTAPVPEISYATGTREGSVLVASNATLSHLSPDGKTVFATRFKERITAPPSIGDDGSVFVTTKSALHCLD